MADEGQFYKFVEGFAAPTPPPPTARSSKNRGGRHQPPLAARRAHAPRLPRGARPLAARRDVAAVVGGMGAARRRRPPLVAQRVRPRGAIQNDDAAAVEAAIMLAEVAADAAARSPRNPRSALSTRRSRSTTSTRARWRRQGPRLPLVALHAPIGGGAFRAAHASLVAGGARRGDVRVPSARRRRRGRGGRSRCRDTACSW